MKVPVSRAALSVLVTLLIGGCSAASSNGSGGPRGSGDVITAEEVEATNRSTAYDAIRARRPAWLQRRGVQSINLQGDIVVYVDGTRAGGPEALHQIHVSAIEEVRYFDASSATQRWGTGHGFGAIQVTTR